MEIGNKVIKFPPEYEVLGRIIIGQIIDKKVLFEEEFIAIDSEPGWWPANNFFLFLGSTEE